MSESYKNVVDIIEGDLASYAIKSFDSTKFVDGEEVFKHYIDIWNKDVENIKLNNRTPIQHQRDKILYSNGVRKQSERYHILFKGGQRIIRNYITHTMRMMQVTRTICRALKLNEDFAEAIVLGSKIGALPFIHASKNKVSDWVIEKIRAIDEKEQLAYETTKNSKINYVPHDYLPNHPEWFRQLKNQKIIKSVEQYIPFAQGQDVNDGYSSGKQGYWLLTTNPYTVESIGGSFTPELMYGIWRHSLSSPIGKDTFEHKQKIQKANNDYHSIDWRHVTFESIVVRYADDITWIIENLNDANNATLVNNPISSGLFQELFMHGKFDNSILNAGLSRRDSGKLYSYFINDFINNSQTVLNKHDGLETKLRLQAGESNCVIGLSKEGNEVLKSFKKFLDNKVFSENRISHRKKMLETITEGCIDLIYDGKEEYLHRYIETKAAIEGWEEDTKKEALSMLNDGIHRVQVSVNVFSELSDQEIFSFVGMDNF